VRVFLAIALDGPVVTTLEHTAQAIKGASPAWRGEKWVPGENLHITVQFLGDVSEEAVPGLLTLMAEVASQHPAHGITLVGVAARPRTRSANMLWATFGGRIDTTETLAEALTEALASASYGHPEHPFAPHATLVRARRPKAIAPEALNAARHVIKDSRLPEVTMSVARVTLFSSTLTPRGPRYEELGSANLVRD
jgi:2'-5' RNA ligase